MKRNTTSLGHVSKIWLKMIIIRKKKKNNHWIIQKISTNEAHNNLKDFQINNELKKKGDLHQKARGSDPKTKTQTVASRRTRTALSTWLTSRPKESSLHSNCRNRVPMTSSSTHLFHFKLKTVLSFSISSPSREHKTIQ